MIQSVISFFLEDEVSNGAGIIDPEKLSRSSPVFKIAARESLLARPLELLAFRVSRLVPEAEGRSFEARVIMCGQPPTPVLYALVEGVAVVMPVVLADLPMRPFLLRLLARKPELEGKRMMFTLDVPGADEPPAREEEPCLSLSE